MSYGPIICDGERWKRRYPTCPLRRMGGVKNQNAQRSKTRHNPPSGACCSVIPAPATLLFRKSLVRESLLAPTPTVPTYVGIPVYLSLPP